MAWNVSMCSWYVVYQLLDGDTSSWWNLASQNTPRSSDSTCSIHNGLEREEFLHKYETRKETYQIPCIWKPLQGPTTKSSVSSYERWFKETSALGFRLLSPSSFPIVNHKSRKHLIGHSWPTRFQKMGVPRVWKKIATQKTDKCCFCH